MYPVVGGTYVFYLRIQSHHRWGIDISFLFSILYIRGSCDIITRNKGKIIQD